MSRRSSQPTANAKTVEQGYGAEHKRLRRRWAREVELGGVRCWRCGDPILPGSRWDLGHNDYDRRFYNGPEHARCNRATSGRKRRSSWDWWSVLLRCARCARELPTSSFTPRPVRPRGLVSWCRSCDNEKSRRYYAANAAAVSARIAGEGSGQSAAAGVSEVRCAVDESAARAVRCVPGGGT
jgi:hypothetical protein